MAEDTCSIEGCSRPRSARGWCRTHYSRWWKAQSKPLRGPQRPPGHCAVSGCERPRRKRDWCEMHYIRWRKNGSPEDHAQPWVIGERGACVVCGRQVPEGIGLRRYCSRGCASSPDREARPRARPCASCGASIDLTERHPSGRLKHANASVCASCRRSTNLRRFVAPLAERDGTACALCGQQIDLQLRHPHPRSRSVDHILPRSKGGRDELNNLQLAHLQCNVSRQDREVDEWRLNSPLRTFPLCQVRVG